MKNKEGMKDNVCVELLGTLMQENDTDTRTTPVPVYWIRLTS